MHISRTDGEITSSDNQLNRFTWKLIS